VQADIRRENNLTFVRRERIDNLLDVRFIDRPINEKFTGINFDNRHAFPFVGSKNII
jgi:hypothetical protein